MDTYHQSITPVYYVIQGRASKDDSTYIEHTFMDINFEESRERAFAYLEYYLQLLQQGKRIFFRENNRLINDEIRLDKIQNYEISFAENNIGLDGIALYMVVNEPLSFNGKTDEKEERYLIFSVKNLSEKKVENIKHSLIREYIYYRKNRNNNFTEDQVTLIDKSFKKDFLNQRRVYTIIKTPYDFTMLDFKIKNNQIFRNKINQELKCINLDKVAFVDSANYHDVNVQLASLINTKGGRVYMCKFIKGEIIPIFKEESITLIKNEFFRNVMPHFKKYKNYIRFHFVKINKILVPIIEVSVTFNLSPSFYNNSPNNNFYYRNRFGLKTINNTEEITDYITKFILNNKVAFDNFLDKL